MTEQPGPEPMAKLVPAGDEAVAVAADALRAGRPVILPTDTVYGLAARAVDAAAVAQLFHLKNRPLDLAIAALVSGQGQAEMFVELEPVRALADAFWPGPLTLVCRKRSASPLVVGAADGTVGVRAPDHEFVLALADAVGPLAATSANISGEATPQTASELARIFGDAVAVIVDDGTLVGRPSTVARVVPLTTRGATVGATTLEVLREGEVSESQLRAALEVAE